MHKIAVQSSKAATTDQLWLFWSNRQKSGLSWWRKWSVIADCRSLQPSSNRQDPRAKLRSFQGKCFVLFRLHVCLFTLRMPTVMHRPALPRLRPKIV
jgi:hypothetical protein